MGVRVKDNRYRGIDEVKINLQGILEVFVLHTRSLSNDRYYDVTELAPFFCFSLEWPRNFDTDISYCEVGVPNANMSEMSDSFSFFFLGEM